MITGGDMTHLTTDKILIVNIKDTVTKLKIEVSKQLAELTLKPDIRTEAHAKVLTKHTLLYAIKSTLNDAFGMTGITDAVFGYNDKSHVETMSIVLAKQLSVNESGTIWNMCRDITNMGIEEVIYLDINLIGDNVHILISGVDNGR